VEEKLQLVSVDTKGQTISWHTWVPRAENDKSF
jgi:hypothetical protein